MTKYLALLLVFWANIGWANQQSFDDFFNNLQTLSADFVQNTYGQNQALISSTSGNLLLSRPHQLKWHTTAPNEQILLLNNQQLWLVDIELEQISRQTLQDLTKTPLYWLINKPKNGQNKPKFAYRKKGINWYRNKNNSKHLEFGFKNHQLQAISFKNALNQTVFIVLNNIVVNAKISRQAFAPNFNPEFDVIK